MTAPLNLAIGLMAVAVFAALYAFARTFSMLRAEAPQSVPVTGVPPQEGVATSGTAGGAPRALVSATVAVPADGMSDQSCQQKSAHLFGLDEGDMVTVWVSYHADHAVGGEPEPDRQAVGVGDALAMALLIQWFEGQKFSPTARPHPDVVSDEPAGLRDRHVVLVGGPKHSGAAEELANRLSLPYWFGGPAGYDLVPASEGELPVFGAGARPPVAASGWPGLDADYGMIVCAPNPWAEDSSVANALLFAGCHGPGTLAAVEALTSEPILDELSAKTAGCHFQAIVRGVWIPRYDANPYPRVVQLVAGPFPVSLV